jgi:hypothetical protein
MDDVTHRHDYCRIPSMVAVGLVRSYKQEKTKNKMDMYPFLKSNTESKILNEPS